MTELKQYRIRASSAAELVARGRGGRRRGHARARRAAALGAAPGGRGGPQPGDRRGGAGRAAQARRGRDRAAARHAHRLRARRSARCARRCPCPQGARDLSRGNPDPALLPDLGRAHRRARAAACASTASARDARAGTALAREQLQADGDRRREALCVVSGALDGIERVLQAHLRPGDRVAVESPGYAALYDLLRAQGLAARAGRGGRPGDAARRARRRRSRAARAR